MELPLRMLVMEDFKGHGEDTRLEEREAVLIDKTTFKAVMKKADLKLEISVDDCLSDSPGEGATLSVSLEIDSLEDFSPDKIARKVPELNQLLELREALVALKGPLGSAPKFRDKLKLLLNDEGARSELEEEIGNVLKKEPKSEESTES